MPEYDPFNPPQPVITDDWLNDAATLFERYDFNTNPDELITWLHNREHVIMIITSFAMLEKAHNYSDPDLRTFETVFMMYATCNRNDREMLLWAMHFSKKVAELLRICVAKRNQSVAVTLFEAMGLSFKTPARE